MNIERQIDNLVKKANFSIRGDVLVLLKKAYAKENSKKAKRALGWLLENAHIAGKEKIALCQDTGLPVVFVEAGPGMCVDAGLIGEVKRAIAQSYKKEYLRASIVDPLKRAQPAYEGAVVDVEFSSGIKGIRLSILPKGFGSENKSQVRMFNPTAAIDDIEDFIVESVKKAGPESCPPFFVGVGIGGTSDYALLLAKKALLCDLVVPTKDVMIRKIENKVLTRINKLNIGPMGLGGKCTALAVKIKTAPTHIAGLPVGINISCHALRSASIILK